ncbi:CusA/CzcA family heavy metal efflux RND transporter [bacterium]|nr:CusA/CzcA family heavy metal efflux RND transporter [bacterium]
MQPTDPEKSGLIGRIIENSARNPFITLLLIAALVAWSWYALMRTPLDAIPDLSDVQVIVLTEWSGRSPDLVEDQITYPISSALLSAPKVTAVRGQSFFGLSFVYATFEDGTDMYWARTRVLEYMTGLSGKLPDGVTPTLGPDATGVGWVFMYALVDDTGKHDLQQLRAIQDWNVRYALAAVPGVADVASIGGFVKQYQIHLDPVRMRALDVMLMDVADAVKASNEDTGGHVVEVAGHEHMIRGRGYVKDISDLESIPLRVDEHGTPVLLSQVGEVTLGPDMRRGIAELNGEGEVVGGVVVMRYGENALTVIERVKERIDEIKAGLPEGVRFEITYDRSGLIKDSIATLKHTLIEEMIVVSIVIFLFLLHARSALVPIITLPIAVLLSFIPMFYQGLTANIMSLGGIAVAIGAMVDASIIIIENIHKRLEEWEAGGRAGDRVGAMVDAMKEVGPSIFFSLLVITVSFMPVFTLEATEGRLFKPLAFTKTYSMGFAAILAVTLTPALAALVVRGRIRREDENPLNRWLVAGYTPVVRFVVTHRLAVIVATVVAMIVTVPAFLRLGGEFMPPLNEGAILHMPSSPPGMSVTQASAVIQAMDRQIREVTEVASVFGKMGRAETATDPAPVDMAETTIVLKPREEWREGLTWDDLIAELDEKIRVPGLPNIWWMPIQTRTEMLATGVRSPLAVLVFGDDYASIERAGVEVERVLTDMPGTRTAVAERSAGAFYIDIHVNREKAARFGLTVRDVNEVVTMAIGGMSIAETVEGRERYPINVRYAREFRDDPEQLGNVLIATKSGAQIPISQVADIKHVNGPPMIRSEDGKLVGFVFVDPGKVPMANYVEMGRRALEQNVELPAGVRLSWTGQFRYLERAKAKLKIVVPLTLLIVFVLLYFNTKSVVETFIVLLAVPFSLIGAVWLLYLLDYNMSVAVWVGLIALAGLDAETGVVMLLYLKLSYQRHRKEGAMRSFEDLREAIVDGAARRIRPKLMTVLTTMIGLAPVLWSTGTGADVMKRIAAPMIGGLVTSFFLELTVYPAIFAFWKGREFAHSEEVSP